MPIDRATAYAAEDADVALRLWQALRSRLRFGKSLALYEQMERRLTGVLMDMERAGIKVDADDLRRMSVDFEQRMAVIERECHRLAGFEFNLGSPKQLGEVLFDKMGLPGGKRMKTGAWGTDSSVLQGLADQGLELPARVLDWRQLQKLKSTYADSLVQQINPDTGRVHTSFAQAIASTGRLSSNDPNLQNIPIRTEEGSRIRHAFIAEPGHVLVSCDYSQIELRLLAHVAELPALRDSFARGEDIHARTASEVFGVPMEGMDPMTRRRAKAINFGIIYGISGYGLGRQLGIGTGEATVGDLVDLLGLGGYRDHYIADLSTGTRRVVELAGLLALDAKVLCLDEPTAGLAQRETEAFGPLIVTIRRQLDASVLLIEHDMPLIMGISDRVYCLEAGKVIAEGHPAAVRDNPRVIASYLGTDERAINRSGAEADAEGVATAPATALRTEPNPA